MILASLVKFPKLVLNTKAITATHLSGQNDEAEKCIKFTRELFLESKNRWSNELLTGQQIYQFIKNKTETNGYRMMEDFDGHRISDFPHHKYTNKRLAQTTFTPTKSFWILELQINDSKNRFGAFFEDIL